MSLIAELRRRNVLRVAAGYALVAWILIEAGSVLLPEFFGAPDYVFRIYVLLVFAGFLVSLVVAWVFELTPEGVRLERDLDRNTRPTPRRGGNVLLIALLVVALAVSLTFNISGIRRDSVAVVAGVDGEPASVAVLPFTNTSADTENQAFADGLHGDLLSRLSGIDALHVISRTSVNEYRDSSKKLGQIAQELGVDNLVEGTVQRAGSQVRINVTLREGASEQLLWSERFDRELTVENLFAIQSEITNRVADALQATLSPEDARRSGQIRTRSIDAFEIYGAATTAVAERQFESLKLAQHLFDGAIELDPGYAEAHAGRATAALLLYINYQGIARDEAYDIAERSLERALELDPELADAHATKGLLLLEQWRETRVGDLIDQAASSLETARTLGTSSTDASVWLASLREEQGLHDESVALLEDVLSRDPRSRIPYLNLATILSHKGRHEESLEMLVQATRRFSGWSQPYNYLSQSLQRLGRIDEAIAWDRLGARQTNDPLYGGQLIGALQVLGESERIRDYLQSIPDSHPLSSIADAFVEVLAGDIELGVAELEALYEAGNAPPMVPKFLSRLAVMDEEYAKARRIILDDVPSLSIDSDKLVTPFNLKDAVVLAFVLEQTGDAEQARRLLTEAQRVLEGRPRLGYSGYGITDVEVFSLLGQLEFALTALETAVAEGFVGSQLFDFWSMDENPLLDPIRDEPRYAAVAQRLEERRVELRESVERAERTGDWHRLRDILEADIEI